MLGFGKGRFKMRGAAQLRALALAALVFWAAVSPALAQPVEGERRVEVPLFSENQVLEQPRSKWSSWFALPRGAVVSSAQLRLHISASETLVAQRSSMTLFVNGEAMDTAETTGLMRRQGGIWEVDIPADALHQDGRLNELSIISVHRSIIEECADIDNPANWVKLHKDSSLSLGVMEEGTPHLADAYTRLYDSLENGEGLFAEFVLGEPAEAAHSAMLRIAAAIGREYPYRDDIRVSAVKAAQGALPNQIFVGEGGGEAGLPALFAEEGYLAISGENGKNRLWVAGADGAGLLKAAALLTDRNRLEQVDAPSIKVKEALPPEKGAGVVRESGQYTLEDFGYESHTLAGAFHQKAQFSVKQPGGLQSGARSYVELRFRHSEALIPDRSLLTVTINGVPMGSAKLSAGNADGGRVKVQIPEEALSGEQIQIGVEVFHYLGKIDCAKDESDTAWTVVEGDSAVYFEPGKQAIRPTLSGFPALSAGSGETVVVASEASSLAAALAVRAGQLSGRAGSWRLSDPSVLLNPNADADYLILDEDQSIDLPDALKQALAVAPQGENGFLVSPHIDVLADALPDKAVIQVARSPWNFDRRVYLISYPAALKGNVLSLLEEGRALRTLDGQVSLLSAGGKVTTHAFEEEHSAENPPLTVERAAYLVERATGHSVEVLAILALLLIVIAYFIVRVLRNKSRFKSAAKGVQDTNRQEGEKEEEQDSES